MSFYKGPGQGEFLPEGFFDPIDVHFARFIMQLAGSSEPGLMLAAALLSRSSREGHTCLDLNEPLSSLIADEESALAIDIPSPEAWQAALKSTPVVGSPGDYRPLILDDGGRLYLYRSFESERLLGENLLRLNAGVRFLDVNLLRSAIVRLFAHDNDQGDSRQKTAAVIALARSLCVITGGPGTGKTTLVTRIIALLLEMEPHLKIVLAAPTGKAARRIEESVRSSIDKLECTPRVKAAIPREASTIHRLLGIVPWSSRPRFHPGNPLSADVVVIDEASMADLVLMSNLIQALKKDTRLILLGDKNQLASVAAGYVLGDICDVGSTHTYSTELSSLLQRAARCAIPAGGAGGMQDSLVELTRTYRFSEDSMIFGLSEAVNSGDTKRCLEVLRSATGKDLVFKDLPSPAELRERLQDVIIREYRRYLALDDIRERFSLFESFRILSPVREGPYGVRAMNRMAEDILHDAGLLEPGGLHYHGRPVLITQNDYTMRLFNGDIGLIINDGGDLRACFKDKDGSIRKVSPLRLPAHETAFAMTVHKSQGSEFDHILFILPDRDSPVLTRELVYTAITRARDIIEIWAHDGIFASAVARRTRRSSGLKNLLWGNP